MNMTLLTFFSIIPYLMYVFKFLYCTTYFLLFRRLGISLSGGFTNQKLPSLSVNKLLCFRITYRRISERTPVQVDSPDEDHVMTVHNLD